MTQVDNGDYQFIITPKLKFIRLPEKCGNQSVHATTMRKSSCHSMLIPLVGLKRM